MADAGSECAQLATEGYCIVNQHGPLDLMRDVTKIISDWFEHASQQQKCDVAASPTDVAAAAGRGYFAMPAKEVLEVSQTWSGSGVGADVRLAAKSALSTLQQVACDTTKLVLSQPNDFKVSQQQLKQIIGQQQSGHHQSHNSSILHINKYRPTGPAAAAVEEPVEALKLQGCEAHVDRGLLTVIHATGSGLQVFSRDGTWVPVTPGPGQLVILVGHTLSFMTAGRLPAALHRVVTPPAAEGGDNDSNSSSRLSLCFKLRADPDALLSPAKVTGTRADHLPVRYRAPKTVQQLLEEFDATHTSIHIISVNGAAIQQQQPQQQQQHLKQKSAAARRSTQSRVSVNTRSSLEQEQKRRRLQPTQQDVSRASAHTGRILTIVVQNESGAKVQFKVRPGTKMQEVLDAYSAKEHGTESLSFVFDGCVVNPQVTPASLGMEDGDIIDALSTQLVGTGYTSARQD